MADLSDEALWKVYDDVHCWRGPTAAIRAVVEYAARAQRDMEPTEEMIDAGETAQSDSTETLTHYPGDGGDSYDYASPMDDSVKRIFLAMQRAAPLVTEAKP